MSIFFLLFCDDLRDVERTFKQKTIEAEESRAKGEITKEQIDKNLQKYTDAILIAQRELLRLRAERDQNIHTAKEQEITLFGLGNKQKGNLKNYTFEVPKNIFSMLRLNPKPIWADCEFIPK